jgi:phosphoglycerol transferase MdoB-like AlkP superfamily enzyme
VSAPLAAFLIYARLTTENRYVSYSLPLLGEFPNGIWFDLTILLALIVGWCLAAQVTWLRRLYLAALIPIGAFVLLFRTVDHYYYHATRSPFNGYVLYGNVGMVQEGAGVVLSAPVGLVALLLVTLHYVLYAAVSRYRAAVRGIATRLAAVPRMPVLAALGVLGAVLLVNLHAIKVHPRRIYTLTTLSGEYQLVSQLPAFFRERASAHDTTAVRPKQFYLPTADAAGVTQASAAPRLARKPDIVIVTIESFNALYTLPPKELNPGLTEEVMPVFKSLGGDGFYFSKVYTSAAYTFNGIISVLCSQYTMSESVWGPGCLPEVLKHNGYEPFSFISINQLRPYRYETFNTAGFDREHVYDAVRMRQGKKNIYFDFLSDKEVFDFAAHVADSVAHVPNRKPMLLHLSTNQMHVPGMIRSTTCKPYPFASSLEADAMTKSMLSSARCTDRDLGELIANLKRSGIYDDAIVVITADHAFNLSFWDHTESELARIPLFVKFPKSARPAAVDTAQLAGQVDIAPTILDYLGLHAERAMYGRSLLAPASPGRHIVGISASRLLSLASNDGIVFHSRGQADYSATMARGFKLEKAGAVATDPAVQSELDALFDTVLYFDQNPKAFATVLADSAAPRWHASPR